MYMGGSRGTQNLTTHWVIPSSLAKPPWRRPPADASKHGRPELGAELLREGRHREGLAWEWRGAPFEGGGGSFQQEVGGYFEVVGGWGWIMQSVKHRFQAVSFTQQVRAIPHEIYSQYTGPQVLRECHPSWKEIPPLLCRPDSGNEHCTCTWAYPELSSGWLLGH